MHPDRIGPRDLRHAGLTAGALICAGAGATLSTEVMAVVAGRDHDVMLASVAALVMAVVGVAVLRWYQRMPTFLWMTLALAMAAAILVMNLLTEDAGGGAQMAYLFPAVYAGAFLRASAAWIVAGWSVLGHAVTVYVLLPTDVALPDTIFALIVIGALTVVLTTSGQRQDALTRELRALASVDLLTGLATRRALEAVASAPEPATSGPGRALVLLDVDQFKELNDEHGHPVGDAVLAHLGRVLQDVVRAGDVVARWGGDEIAVLMLDIGPEDARRRAEALRAAVLARPLVRPEGTLRLTVSVGVVHAACRSADLATMYSGADAALYQAKREGRDRVVVGPAVPSRTLVP